MAVSAQAGSFCQHWRLLAKVECPKGWEVAPLLIFVVRPVGRSDLTSS